MVAERVCQRLAAYETRRAKSEPVEPDFYTEIELARRSRINPRTLQGWRLRGGGPPWVKVGKRKILYPRVEAHAFLRLREAKTTTGSTRAVV
jgi:hypothetical protein